MSEGKVTNWFKAVGDSVQVGDKLFEIETDKVTMEIEATEGGMLSEIRVRDGTVAPVGAVVAIIGDGNSGRARAAPRAAARRSTPVVPSRPAGPAPTGRTAPCRVGGPIKLDPFLEVRTPTKTYGRARTAGGAIATPLARRLAAETGIDLATLKGSGPGGRITANDINRRAILTPPRRRGAGPATRTSASLYRDTLYEEVPLDGMRKTIAARLLQAKQTVPHFYIVDDVDIGAMAALREQVNAAAPRDKEAKPAYEFSLNDSSSRPGPGAPEPVPAANAVWAGDRILRFTRSDVAVAVAMDGGLITR